MTVTPTTVDARGMRFDALVSGPVRGEPVLLLHGFPQSAECWRPALTALGRAGYRAVAFDQRGYSAGAYPEDVDAYRLEEIVADALAVADTLGFTRFHVAGHDWGGVVGWHLASSHPSRLLSHTAVTTAHPTAMSRALQGLRQSLRSAYVLPLRTPMLPETLIRIAGGAAAVRLLMLAGQQRNLAERDVARLRSIGPSGALNWYRALGRSSFRVGRVGVPTLHVWADRDPAFGREATDLTAEYMDGPYHLLELQDATHWVPDLHWSDVEDVFLDHLARHPGRAGRSGR